MARKWLNRLDVTTLFIEPGSPWENGYIESFNGKMRDELLNGEVLDTLEEAKVLVEAWRKTYNRIRPHSSLGYRPPAAGPAHFREIDMRGGAGYPLVVTGWVDRASESGFFF
jgi:transposase InsO family protein